MVEMEPGIQDPNPTGPAHEGAFSSQALVPVVFSAYIESLPTSARWVVPSGLSTASCLVQQMLVEKMNGWISRWEDEIK